MFGHSYSEDYNESAMDELSPQTLLHRSVDFLVGGIQALDHINSNNCQ